MSYKVKLFSDEYGIAEFTYDNHYEQLAGAQRLQRQAILENEKDGIYREVVICIGEESDGLTDLTDGHELTAAETDEILRKLMRC